MNILCKKNIIRSNFYELLLICALRTNTIGAVARVRNSLAYATHRFFQERGFFNVMTPIITASDCEGAGQMFQVTTLDLMNLPRTQDGKMILAKIFLAKLPI